MPTQRTVTVYKFSELSPAAKKVAIEKWREVEHENLEPSRITESFEERLKEVGLPHKTVEWSLGHVQGDGVWFYGPMKLTEYLKKNKLAGKYKILSEVADDITVQIERAGRDHMNFDMQVYGDLTPEQKAASEKLYEHIKEHIKDFSDELQKDGYTEIDYLTSEEVAKEALEEDDLDFEESGRRSRV